MKNLGKKVDSWMDKIVEIAIKIPIIGLFIVIIGLLSIGLITSFIVSTNFPWTQSILAGSQVAWIGFYGSVIAGALTLFGVRVTIEHNGLVVRQNNKNSVKPYLLVNNIINPTKFSNQYPSVVRQEVKVGKSLGIQGQVTTYVHLINGGVGNAVNVTCELIVLDKNGTQLESNMLSFPVVSRENAAVMCIVLLNSLKSSEKYFVFRLIYFDIIGTKYSQEIKIHFESDQLFHFDLVHVTDPKEEKEERK
ncbi:hypothetical protein J0B03_05450 [Alkalibacter rhizosphaerae]|uniref:Uncharacterized protein n=1 Tax=Alkalibacter rhizosphaerae TaxID=2815577 RepID=A0A974XGM5_9FIRM|nr:hypothetical protein [Alkalibacter rhizosphaerae]QSX09509.1 hypothetical protein J0B03_05450 [Alkalibacter rhizosphaerae]